MISNRIHARPRPGEKLGGRVFGRPIVAPPFCLLLSARWRLVFVHIPTVPVGNWFESLNRVSPPNLGSTRILGWFHL
jgi:hypothetical protein